MNWPLFSKQEKKENLVQKLKLLPKRKITEIEQQIIFILIEKSKIQRERSMNLLNKGVLIFFAFIIIVYLGKTNNYISDLYMNILFLFGVIILIVTIATYEGTIRNEEKTLDELLDSFLK